MPPTEENVNKREAVGGWEGKGERLAAAARNKTEPHPNSSAPTVYPRAPHHHVSESPNKGTWQMEICVIPESLLIAEALSHPYHGGGVHGAGLRAHGGPSKGAGEALWSPALSRPAFEALPTQDALSPKLLPIAPALPLRPGPPRRHGQMLKDVQGCRRGCSAPPRRHPSSATC